MPEIKDPAAAVLKAYGIPSNMLAKLIPSPSMLIADPKAVLGRTFKINSVYTREAGDIENIGDVEEKAVNQLRIRLTDTANGRVLVLGIRDFLGLDVINATDFAKGSSIDSMAPVKLYESLLEKGAGSDDQTMFPTTFTVHALENVTKVVKTKKGSETVDSYPPYTYQVYQDRADVVNKHNTKAENVDKQIRMYDDPKFNVDISEATELSPRYAKTLPLKRLAISTIG